MSYRMISKDNKIAIQWRSRGGYQTIAKAIFPKAGPRGFSSEAIAQVHEEMGEIFKLSNELVAGFDIGVTQRKEWISKMLELFDKWLVEEHRVEEWMIG